MTCTRCGGPTRFVPQYQQQWCDQCQQYVGAAGTPGAPAAPRKAPNYWLIIGLPVALVSILVGVVVFMFVRNTGDAMERYVKKAKTSESHESLHALIRGAEAYYYEEHPGDSLQIVTHQLPPAAGPTPPLGACCEDGAGKCMPDMALWDQPTWRALQFEMTRPHYYSYEFRPDGEDGMIEVYAYGDLDCDGTYSTFMLSARTGDLGFETAGAIYRVNETE